MRTRPTTAAIISVAASTITGGTFSTYTDSLTARVGRQKLLYGAQRLVSPLDWANIRRTFDGARVLYKEGDWAVDVFFTYFVPPIFDELDKADSDQPFYGSWGTYSGFETYYLGYENNNVGATNGTADFSLHTLGLRLSGRKYTNPDCRYRFHVL